MKNFYNIHTLLDEIAFYEENGYHKIADNLTEKLIKLSWNFDISAYNDPYASSLGVIAKVNAVRTMMQKVPECAALLAQFNNAVPQQWQDPRDCMIKAQQQNSLLPPEQQKTNDQLREECMNSAIKGMDSAVFGQTPEYDKCREGMAKLGMGPQFDQSVTQIKSVS